LAQSELDVGQKGALVGELVKKSGLAAGKSSNKGFQLGSVEDIGRLGRLNRSQMGILLVGVQLQEGLIVN